ncbi:MAG: N-methyl-L-tryptophan oxidase, partial [Planctomycetales bacterium]|nr:N-methyl-L-tryptophan oxidase [Planctomycetales bacterium]
GGIGSAALGCLARRGLKVLGIDRFDPPHDRGSSHGHTRVIREAYFEHSSYVPLAQRSAQMWRALEAETGSQLYDQVGILEVGPPDGVVIPGVLQSVHDHQLPVERLTNRELRQRFPQFSVPSDHVGIVEANAGFLYVERCVETYLDVARRHGVDIMSHCEVIQWQAERDAVRIQTKSTEYVAARLLITAGPWAQSLLSSLNIPLSVVRKQLYWLSTSDIRLSRDEGCPVFFFEARPGEYYYGFPQLDDRGVKIARHDGGTHIVGDPVAAIGGVDEEDRASVSSFASAVIPGLNLPETSRATCFYTLSPDEHFIVDRVPDQSQVAFVAGLSGHGFKFAPVLGEALADLAIDGDTDIDIDFLRLGRFRTPPAPGEVQR